MAYWIATGAAAFLALVAAAVYVALTAIGRELSVLLSSEPSSNASGSAVDRVAVHSAREEGRPSDANASVIR
jgi:hypothetical protein